MPYICVTEEINKLSTYLFGSFEKILDYYETCVDCSFPPLFFEEGRRMDRLKRRVNITKTKKEKNSPQNAHNFLHVNY